MSGSTTSARYTPHRLSQFSSRPSSALITRHLPLSPSPLPSRCRPTTNNSSSTGLYRHTFATPNEIIQNDDDIDGLTAHPHRDSIEIARISGKTGMAINTYFGHLAQIAMQRSTEASRVDDARSSLQTFSLSSLFIFSREPSTNKCGTLNNHFYTVAVGVSRLFVPFRRRRFGLQVWLCVSVSLANVTHFQSEQNKK